MRILGAFSMQLRRLAQATRLTGQGQSLGAALAQAGVPPLQRAPPRRRCVISAAAGSIAFTIGSCR